MAEVSDSQLRILKGAYDLLSVLESNKDTGRTFRSLVKKIKPEITTPDDIAEPYVAEVRAELKEVKDLVTKRFKDDDDAKLDRELNDIWQSLKKDGMTDEAKSDVAKLMQEKKIGDPEAAWALYRKNHPPAPTMPSVPGDSRWPSIAEAQKSNELLFRDPDAWARNETQKVIEEFRGNRAA